MKVKSFGELEIWKIFRKLANLIFDIVNESKFKKEFSLINQLKRAAVSPMANIAESFMRGGNKEFIQYLYISRGSIGETKSHLYLCVDRGYINKKTI